MAEYMMNSIISLSNYDSILEEINVLLELNNSIKLNFSNVIALDSTGIGMLVAIHKRCNDKDKELVLTNINGRVKRILDITMLDEYFTFEG